MWLKITTEDKKMKLNNHDSLNGLKVIKGENIEKIGEFFECSDKEREALDACLVIALFEALYKQNKINKKEYDTLISKARRTHYLSK